MKNKYIYLIYEKDEAFDAPFPTNGKISSILRQTVKSEHVYTIFNENTVELWYVIKGNCNIEYICDELIPTYATYLIEWRELNELPKFIQSCLKMKEEISRNDSVKYKQDWEKTKILDEINAELRNNIKSLEQNRF